MTDTQSQTESILDIIKGVDNRSIMSLPSLIPEPAEK